MPMVLHACAVVSDPAPGQLPSSLRTAGEWTEAAQMQERSRYKKAGPLKDAPVTVANQLYMWFDEVP